MLFFEQTDFTLYIQTYMIHQLKQCHIMIPSILKLLVLIDKGTHSKSQAMIHI